MKLNIPDGKIADVAAGIRTIYNFNGSDRACITSYIKKHLIDLMRKKAVKDAKESVQEPTLDLTEE